MGAGARISILRKAVEKKIAPDIATREKEEKMRGFLGRALIANSVCGEKDYKPIKRDDKMSDLTRRMTGMSSGELADCDFETPEYVRRAREEMLRDNAKRRRELNGYFRTRKLMGYIERVVGWVDRAVGRFYSGRRNIDKKDS